MRCIRLWLTALLGLMVITSGCGRIDYTPLDREMNSPEELDSAFSDTECRDACQTPPPAECIGTNLRSHAMTGTCRGGVCSYETMDVPCLWGCHEGRCITDALDAYLKASDTGAGDLFGHSISLSGDLLAVGAYQEGSSATGVNGDHTNNDAPNSGAVYVFRRSAEGTWSQEAYIKASNTNANDRFGGSVSLSGDLLAVGAYGEGSSATGVNGNQTNNDASWSGAVYVFRRSTGGVWSQEAYIKASNANGGDQFGWSVFLVGDFLAVGAPRESSSAIGVNGDQTNNDAVWSGAVYVFRRSAGGTWSQEAYIKASNTESSDHFGRSVSLSGDLLAVGAYVESSSATGVNGNQTDNGASSSGAVYVFRRSAEGVWSQEAYIKASNTGAGDLFGDAISFVGNLLAVGAVREDSSATGVNGNQADNGAPSSGAVYLFRRSAEGVWAQEAYIKASNTEGGDQFGSSVSLSGNLLVVGAFMESSSATGVNGDQANNGTSYSGAVYVYTH